MSTEHKSDPPSEDERQLQALFDETASKPEPAVLQRMARAAAQIPDLRQPWYRQLWSPRALAISAMIGAAALALVMTLGKDDGNRVGPLVEQSSVTAPTTSDPTAPSNDEAIEELLAFELTDNGDEEVASLDADPMASWDGNDDGFLVDDHPISALDVLFVDGDDDIEMLGTIFDDMLAEGG